MRKAGYQPDDVFSPFEAMLCDPDYRDVLAELRQSPPERPVSRLDSHPTLTQRLAALTVLELRRTAPAELARPAAVELLTTQERQAISRDLRREMFRAGRALDSAAPAELPWQEWVSTAATLQAAGPAAGAHRRGWPPGRTERSGHRDAGYGA